MSLRDDVIARLTGDAALMAILPGGLHSGTEISRQNTPGAFDGNKELLPCALLRFDTTLSADNPYRRAAREFWSVLIYQRAGVDQIELARARVYELLHDQRFGSVNMWLTLHTDDVRDIQDQTLLCEMAISRFMSWVMR